jgi:hypothetical protein
VCENHAAAAIATKTELVDGFTVKDLVSMLPYLEWKEWRMSYSWASEREMALLERGVPVGHARFDELTIALP